MKKLLFLPLCLLLALTTFAEKDKKKKAEAVAEIDSVAAEIAAYEKFSDSVASALKYQTGKISLKGDHAELNVPAGFKFLNAEQTQFVVHDIWGNPKRDDILGMILPATSSPLDDSSYAFIVSFDDMGYVKDDDAKDIDYDKMLKDEQKEEPEQNKERAQMGYEPIHFAGWAQKPFYDEKKKVLHWAKDLQFGDNENHTLNYDVRVLGRKGVLSLNAVSSMSGLPLVKKDIDKVLAMASFTDGNRYADFNSSTDKIAVYTIGGLVAGKVLAKAGLFAIIAKFGKFIVMGIIAIFYAVRKWLTGRGRP
ncbi:DUF2167 domain-containing protein [Foetidibacter luteolus]|uniref:DUF2167 domain-containing protein n=1 Tax=Foetidibacter luteolus TaxID=2608880 RepID=UPI00129BE24F|nr:DUF2167 domain-containing protein [Foetidibacter luteolus]